MSTRRVQKTSGEADRPPARRQGAHAAACEVAACRAQGAPRGCRPLMQSPVVPRAALAAWAPAQQHPPVALLQMQSEAAACRPAGLLPPKTAGGCGRKAEPSGCEGSAVGVRPQGVAGRPGRRPPRGAGPQCRGGDRGGAPWRGWESQGPRALRLRLPGRAQTRRGLRWPGWRTAAASPWASGRSLPALLPAHPSVSERSWEDTGRAARLASITDRGA